MGPQALAEIPPRTSPEEVRQAVERVFSQADYDLGVRPIDTPQSLIDQIRSLIKGVFGFFVDIVQWIKDLHGTEPVLYWLLMGGMLAVLCLLILHITYSVRMTLSALRTVPRAAEEEEKIRKKRFRELRGEAHGQATKGDFGGAVRTLLLAIFARFEDTRRGDVQEGWTNHEVVERIRTDDVDRGSLRELALAVDRVWYGRQPASEVDYDEAARIVDALARR